MSSKRGRFQNRNKPYHQNNDNKPRPRKEYSTQEQLSEVDVGITEFQSNLEGFSAVIKARFSDFQVNEINLDGVVAKLTDTAIPKDFQMKLVTVDYKEIINSPCEFIPQEKWEGMKKLVELENSEPVFIEANNFDKEARTAVHTCVKSHFGRKIVASTVEKDGKKYVEIRKFYKENRSDSRSQWPEDKGEYVHFILYKESLDTMDAILKLSDMVNVPASAFSYAGVKDKRAKTTQWCSVRRVEPWKLLMKTNSQRNIKVGNLTFEDKPLSLGQLKGNRFRIALRNVLANDELIEKSMKFIEENGFINYYGLQRFGNDKEVPTHLIGVKLLLGQWKEACDLILKPKDAEDQNSDVVKAKKIYTETKDPKKAFEAISKCKYKTLEGRLLQGLKSNNKHDYVAALESIPRYTRLTYMNAFQSLIWNKMVSQRIKLFGLKPVVGDLVFTEQSENQTEQDGTVDISEESTTVNAEDGAEEKEETDEAKNGHDELAPSLESAVKVLEEKDLSHYTIYDIVLPLPGYGIRYPEYLKSYYKEAIEEFGLSLEMAPQKVRMYSTRGTYRNIMKKLHNVSWKILMYKDPTDNLIRSDFEELKGQPEPESMELGRYKSLVIQFDLTPSCYATMVLRELLKSDTSTSAQAKLNKYHDEGRTIKISVEQDTKTDDKHEESDTGQQSSLLSNPEKYEQFKNSIFKDIVGCAKRKNDGEEESDVKKIKIGGDDH